MDRPPQRSSLSAPGPIPVIRPIAGISESGYRNDGLGTAAILVDPERPFFQATMALDWCSLTTAGRQLQAILLSYTDNVFKAELGIGLARAMVKPKSLDNQF